MKQIKFYFFDEAIMKQILVPGNSVLAIYEKSYSRQRSSDF